jgi:hypothetical protein
MNIEEEIYIIFDDLTPDMGKLLYEASIYVTKDKIIKFKEVSRQRQHRNFKKVFYIKNGEIQNKSTNKNDLELCYSKNGKFQQAILLLQDGVGIRECSRILKMSTNTISKYAKRLDGLKCKCGQPLIPHTGWCKYRYERSEKRKLFIQNWKKK